MRLAAIFLAALVAGGCASRQGDSSTAVARGAPPLNYEATVTSYFDLTTRVAPSRRKLVFGAPEASGCMVLGSSSGHLGWVVPVTLQVAPPPAPPPAAAAPAPTPAAAAPKPTQVASKGKTTRGKGKGKDKSPLVLVGAASAPAAAPAQRVVIAPPPGVAALDEVSVTGNTRYFFWFNKETINAVSRRIDVCP